MTHDHLYWELKSNQQQIKFRLRVITKYETNAYAKTAYGKYNQYQIIEETGFHVSSDL